MKESMAYFVIAALAASVSIAADPPNGVVAASTQELQIRKYGRDFIENGDQPDRSEFQIADSKLLEAYGHSEARDHFFKWVRGGGPAEIKTLWFSDGYEQVGMVGSADLEQSVTLTDRDCYNWAHQVTETRRLSNAQVLNLRELIANLPKSDPPKELRDLVVVSVPNGKQRRLFCYDRTKLPIEVRRIFDNTGAYIVTSK
jgi:hypothetical protein